MPSGVGALHFEKGSEYFFPRAYPSQLRSFIPSQLNNLQKYAYVSYRIVFQSNQNERWSWSQKLFETGTPYGRTDSKYSTGVARGNIFERLRAVTYLVMSKSLAKVKVQIHLIIEKIEESEKKRKNRKKREKKEKIEKREKKKI